jgi:hypothetical protein
MGNAERGIRILKNEVLIDDRSFFDDSGSALPVFD